MTIDWGYAGQFTTAAIVLIVVVALILLGRKNPDHAGDMSRRRLMREE